VAVIDKKKSPFIKKNLFPQRMQEAVNAWEKYTEGMRRRRKQMLSHLSNGWYSNHNKSLYSFAETPQPINLIDRGVSIIAPLLVSQNPRANIMPRAGTNSPAVKAFSRTLELALAHLFEEIRLAEYTLRPLVVDSLFSMGITKTGTMHSHEVEIGGYLHDVGQPYCDRIDFDDYIGDVAARNRQEMKIEGHWYRLPEEYVKTSGLYKNYDKITPDLERYGDSTKPESIAKSDAVGNFQTEIFPTVELCDLWIPHQNIMITIPREGYGNKIMRTVEWDGPEEGPFDVLAYKYFPDSVIPIPPVYTWMDLNKAINVIVTKMRDDTDRQKTVGLYNTSNADDAARIKNTSSGNLVGVEDVNSIRELTYGGFNEQSFPFVQFLLHQWSQTGPNLDVMGGRKLDAPTLGQEQMMQANAGRELDDMVNQMYQLTRSVTKKLAWFLWSDPLITVPLIKRVAGVDLKVEYSESAKEGDFFDYTFDIQPYSMMKMNPEMRYQRLMQFVQGYILPTAQIAAQQGTVLNVPELAKEMARYLGINNLDDWYMSQTPMNPGMNPYTPEQGSVSGQSGSTAGGGDEGSNFNNQVAQQTAAGGKTTGSLP